MFRVRSVTPASTTLKEYYQYSLARQGWRTCIGDVNCYLELDPTSVYVGELNGEPIGTSSIIKYGNGLCHMGSLTIEPKHQKEGYGIRLQKAHVQHSGHIRNLVGYATPEYFEMFKKWHGMIPRWELGIYDLDISKALNTLRVSSDYCEVKNVTDIDIQDLYKYDSDVFGYNRSKFLKKWLTTMGAHARVAVNRQGSILGYVAVRTAFFKEEGYKLGPLFCENIDVGKALLKGVFEDVREFGLSSSNSVILDCPIGKNPEAQQLMEFVSAKYLGPIKYVSTSAYPKKPFNQWFAVTSAQCG